MIAKILPIRSDCRHTLKYAFGQTDSKEEYQAEEAYFLASNGLTVPDPTLSTEEDDDGNLQIVRVPANKANLAPIVEDFERQASRNNRATAPFWHCVLSISPEDEHDQTDDSLRRIATDYMSRMGYEHCPWVATVHRDTAHTHVHLAACTVQSLPNYPVADRYKDFDRAMDACRKIEVKYGLRVVKMPEDGKAPNDSGVNRRITQLRRILDWTLLQELESSDQPDLCSYLSRVQSAGVDVQIKWRQGEPSGVAYSWAGCSYTATKLGGGGRYQLRSLQNFLRYDNDEDHDTLEDIHEAEPIDRDSTRAMAANSDILHTKLRDLKAEADRRAYFAVEFYSEKVARFVASHPRTPVATIYRKVGKMHVLYYRQKAFIPATSREELELRRLFRWVQKTIRGLLESFGIHQDREPVNVKLVRHPGWTGGAVQLPGKKRHAVPEQNR